jgi:hypothetical protein
VDPFTLVVVAGLGVVVLVLWLKSDRELTERREELETEDLDQMLRAHNARKRARGEPEVTAEQLEARVLGEMSGRGRREE